MLNTMLDSFLLILWTTTWQTLLLGTVLAILLWFFGTRIEARWRYLLWCVLLLRFAVPVLPEVSWGWGIGNWELGITSRDLWSRDWDLRDNSSPSPDLHIPNLDTTSAIFQKDEQFSIQIPVSSQPFRMEWENDLAEQPNFVEESEFPNPATTGRGSYLFSFWTIGVLIFLLRLFRSEIKLFRCSRFWKETDEPQLCEMLEACRNRIGVRRRVRLLLAPGNIGAASSGVFRPKIILSEKAVRSFSEEEIRMVLYHELTHIKRFDPIVQRFALFLSVFHWFNPCVWFVILRLQRDRELACDRAVLQLLGNRQQKQYGLTVLAFAESFSTHEPLPGLVGLFLKHKFFRNNFLFNNSQHELTRRIEMIVHYKKSTWFHTLCGLTLVLLFAAFSLTRAQNAEEPKEQPKQLQPIEKSAENHTVVHDAPNVRRIPQAAQSAVERGMDWLTQQQSTTETAKNLPESNDEERLQKIESLKHLLYHQNEEDSPNTEKLFKEQIRLIDALNDPGLKAKEKLEIAEILARREKWNLYTPLVESLDSPFKEMERAYRDAQKDLEENNPEKAKERMLAFEPQIFKMSFGTEQLTAGLFLFTRLGRMGFTDEAVELIKKSLKSLNLETKMRAAVSKKQEGVYFMRNALTYAIYDVGFHLISHGKNPDDKRKAFEFALALYNLDCGNPGHIMNEAIKEIVKEGDFDTAIELAEKIETTLGRQTQWEMYPIIKALLEKDQFDKALELTRKSKSFNESVQKQYYHDLMKYLLQKNETEKCTKILNEALEKAAPKGKVQSRLSYLHLYAQIAKQLAEKLDDPTQITKIANFAREGWNESVNEIPDEREKVHTHCDLAQTLCTLGFTNEAKMEFSLAIKDAEKVPDKTQQNWAVVGVARSQYESGLTEDAWKTVDLIPDKSIKTEAYFYIGNAALRKKDDLKTAKLALKEAQILLKEVKNSRIFGLISSLETEIQKREQSSEGFSKQDSEQESRAWTYLGVRFDPISKHDYKLLYAKHFAEHPDGAIRVKSVRPESPMQKSGIEPGDVIFSIDNYSTYDVDGVDKIVQQLQKNKKTTHKVNVLLSRPRPHESQAANGYFYTELTLP